QDLLAEGLKQTLRWMDAHLRGNRNALRKNPVRIYITGRNTWHECMAYPPAKPVDHTLFLARPDRLQASPGPDGTDTYRYDPADPTPNVGGAIFAFSGAGPRSNNALEARPDVRTYTGDVLEEELTIIGNPKVALFVRSSLVHTDFFVRLCDVSPKGVSTNVCDGILRLTPDNQPGLTEEVTAITITMHACAHSFGPGHRIRLQVSSGAHPRYARNLGTNDPIGSATAMRAADQQIFHGVSTPACLQLPRVEHELE
ncbi:MAG TPA: CocE/NonD family hydrolase, partial [Devosia sp.]|nr:CocE/NonD family hydrolase [Devosia sp.]